MSNVIVNEEAVKFMGLENPIGEKMTFMGQEGQIIGVVKDFHHVSLHKKILPHVFSIHPRNYNALKYIFIKISATEIPSTIDYIKSTTLKFAPDFPFEYNFVN